MAKRRCKKGVVKSGPRKGLCRKVARPGKASKRKASPARKSKSKKSSRKRADCAKWGFSVLLGRCRKGPGGRSGRGGSDSSVAAAMRASMARGAYPVSRSGSDSSVAAAMRAATGRIYGNF